MEFKKVCVYGFEQNAYLFMQPAIRYVLGNIKTSRVTSLEVIRENPPVCDRVDTYYTLSKNQKYAFLYMMTGKTQKELKVDFGFNSLNTAASHWHAVLKKFNVQSVFELRAMFR